MSLDRGATIHIDQLPNGYWWGRVEIRVPGLPPQRFEGDTFHDAGEVLDWARLTIEPLHFLNGMPAGGPPVNCPIREHTGDGHYVGRCDFYAPDGICPRHGRIEDYPTHDDREVAVGARRYE